VAGQHHGGARLYDSIGVGYQRVRRADPRIQRQIDDALGSVRRVVNVGAGSGSYEPLHRFVVGLEPSMEMVRQRSHAAGPAVRGVAEALPFPNASFDGALALLTIHHWPDPSAGLTELLRVTTGPIVIFTFDKSVHVQQWLVAEYLPEMADLDPDLPTPEQMVDALGGGAIEVVPIPADCRDGFCHAWWRRPEAYLDPAVRAGISGIARLPEKTVEQAVGRLADDLATGHWHRTHDALLRKSTIDAGYRLIIARR
jgi:SAM-dependent methyltransferase